MSGEVFGITMMKDEEDVAYGVLMHMAGEGLHGIIVADNNSTDGTRAEIDRAIADLAVSPNYEENRCQIIVFDDHEPGYYQSEKMTALAGRARSLGAEWVIPFDADELWVAHDRLELVLSNLPPAVAVVTAELYNHYCTSLDLTEGNPFERLVWRHPNVGALPKVAFRWNPDIIIGQGNHSVTGEHGATRNLFKIRHFPYRSWEHFRQKAINGAAAYAATDLPRDQGAHWRGYGEILERHGEAALREVFDTYYAFLSPIDEQMICDPAPYRRWT